MSDVKQLEIDAEKKYGLPEGILGSIRQQETGGKQDYIDDPSKAHYPTGRTATGVKSSAFGPYGILESTAKQPGYNTTPLVNKSLESQVEFAAQYLTGRTKSAGSLEAGLAGYGEGAKYANQVLRRNGNTNTMATTSAPAPAASSNINNLAAGNTQRNEAAANALDAFQVETQNQYSGAVKLLQDNAQNVQTIKTTEAMATAQAQANSAQAAKDLGTDPNEANFALNKIADQYRGHVANANKFADRVAFVNDPTNIMKDPLSYIGNALIYDLSLEGQQSAQSAANASKEQYLALNNMTQQFAQTQKAIQQSVTTETAKLMGETAKADIDLQVSKLNLDAIKSNSANVVAVSQLRNEGLGIALKARDQELQEANIKVARQNSELQTRSLELALEDRQERLNLKKETVEDQNRFLRTVNAGRAVNGNLPPFTSFKEMQLQSDMDPKTKEMISAQYKAGLASAATGQAVLASSPYDALKYVTATGAKITDGRSGVINMLNKVKAQVLNDPKIMPTIKKESDLAKAIDGAAQSAAGNMMGNITAGNNNIYAPPAISVFTEDPEFGKTYISTNILRPADQLGSETLNFKNIVNQLMNDARAGKIDYKTADSELGFLAEKIVGYNNSVYRYNETAGLPNMKQVNVALDDTGSFGRFIEGSAGRLPNNPVASILTGTFGGSSETIVDLRDPNKRAAYLNKQMTKIIPPVIREQAAKSNTTKLGAN